jgi:hypothetical protein
VRLGFGKFVMMTGSLLAGAFAGREVPAMQIGAAGFAVAFNTLLAGSIAWFGADQGETRFGLSARLTPARPVSRMAY